jgi:hypothetical protein
MFIPDGAVVLVGAGPLVKRSGLRLGSAWRRLGCARCCFDVGDRTLDEAEKPADLTSVKVGRSQK